MGNRSINTVTYQRNKAIKKAKEALAIHIFAKFIGENAGAVIQHKDREYVITEDGSWRRKTPKKEIIRNSKDYQK